METTELENSKMQVLKEIADSNVILSGIKAEIAQAKKDKDQFFQDRQDELNGLLARFLRDSKVMVDETEKNYTFVHNFYGELREFAKMVREQREEVQEMLVDLDKRSVDFANHLIRETTKLSELEASIKQDRRVVEDDRTYIRVQKEQLTKEKAIFKTQQINLKNALASLNKK